MPPPKKKRAQAPPAHPKSENIPVGTSFTDTQKQDIVIGKELTQGGFGRIYDASVKGKKEKLIAKFEPGSNGPLFVEQNVYTRILSKSMLDKFSKENNFKFLGLPYLVSNGIYNDSRYIVVPKYDYCLEQLMKEKKLSVSEVKQVVHCVLNALKYLHLNGYAHADIKAGNLMLNSKKNFSEVHLIDFGLTMKADKAVDKENKKRAHNGSPFFTSSDAHRGIGPSYRGDIEIVGHNLLLWLTGSLPWLKLENDLDGIMAAKRKLLTNVEKELEAAGIEKSEKAMVAAFYNEANSLGVTEVPDFNKLRKAIDDNNEKTKPAKKIGKTVEDNKNDTEKEVQPKKPTRKGKVVAKSLAKDGNESDTEKAVQPQKTTRKGKVGPEPLVNKKNEKLVNDGSESDTEKEVQPRKLTRKKKVGPEPLVSTSSKKNEKLVKNDNESDTEKTVQPQKTIRKGKVGPEPLVNTSPRKLRSHSKRD